MPFPSVGISSRWSPHTPSLVHWIESSYQYFTYDGPYCRRSSNTAPTSYQKLPRLEFEELTEIGFLLFPAAVLSLLQKEKVKMLSPFGYKVKLT